MRKSYWLPVIAAILAVVLGAGSGLAQEYLSVSAVKNCIGLQNAGSAMISLTPGTWYTVLPWLGMKRVRSAFSASAARAGEVASTNGPIHSAARSPAMTTKKRVT